MPRTALVPPAPPSEHSLPSCAIARTHAHPLPSYPPFPPRTTRSPDVRIAALHTLASAAGLERAAEAGGAAPSGRGLPPAGPLDPSAAALPAQAEQALRVGSYQAAASSDAAQRSPCDALVSLGAQPVPELAVASYRAAAALALRPWFAAELCSSTALLGAVTDPATTTGHETALWRQALLASLWATAKVSYPKGDGAQTALQPTAVVAATVTMSACAEHRIALRLPCLLLLPLFLHLVLRSVSHASPLLSS